MVLIKKYQHRYTALSKYSLCVLLVYLALSMTACKGLFFVSTPTKKSKSSLAQTTPQDTNGNALSLTISKSSPLEYVEHRKTALTFQSSILPLVNAVQAGSAPPAATGPVALTSTISPVTNGILSIDTTHMMSDLNSYPTQHNADTNFTATFSLTGTFSKAVASSLQKCDVLAPYSSVACLISGFMIAGSALTTGSLQARMWVDGDATKVESNQFTTKRYILQKVSDSATSTPFSNTYGAYMNGAYYTALGSVANGASKLFRISGSTLTQLTNMNNGASDSINSLYAFNGYLYAIGHDSASRQKLFRTDGVTSIEQLTDTAAGGHDIPAIMGVCNNYLFFHASTNIANTSFRWFSFDGTTLRRLSNTIVSAGGHASAYRYAKCINGRMVFPAYNAGGRNKLFSSNGTDYMQISDIRGAGTNDNTFMSSAFTLNNRVYFAGQDAAGNYKILSTNGTDVVQHTDILAGGDDFTGLNPVLIGNKSFFSAYATAGNLKVFSFDGTTLTQLTNTNPGGSDAPSSYLLHTSEELFFTARTAAETLIYFVSDGSSYLRRLSPATGFGGFADLLGSSNMILFGGRDSSNNKKYFTYTTNRGAVRITNITPGGHDNIDNYDWATSSYQQDQLGTQEDDQLGTNFTFLAQEGSRYRIFATDGTNSMRMSDISDTGEDDIDFNWWCSGPSHPTNINGRLFFSAYSSITACKNELYMLCIYDGNSCI